MEKRRAWLGLLWMSLRLMRSEAWFTSDEMAGDPGLQGRQHMILAQQPTCSSCSSCLPLKDVAHKVKAGIVPFLDRLLVVVGTRGHQVRDQAVDGIRHSVALIVGHGCCMVSSYPPGCLTVWAAGCLLHCFHSACLLRFPLVCTDVLYLQ